MPFIIISKRNFKRDHVGKPFQRRPLCTSLDKQTNGSSFHAQHLSNSRTDLITSKLKEKKLFMFRLKLICRSPNAPKMAPNCLSQHSWLN